MLNKNRLEPEVVKDTLGAILKYQADIAEVQKSYLAYCRRVAGTCHRKESLPAAPAAEKQINRMMEWILAVLIFEQPRTR